MRALTAAAVLLTAWPASAQDTGHEYVLTAELDPEAHTVEGTARIRWRNDSATEATEIWLHLYLNGFADEDTVFMRESRGALRGVTSDGEGKVELSSLSIVGGADLLAGADDEIIAGDKTQMRVPLPEPVPPGGTLELETAFTSTLPPVFARSGYSESFHMVAQWFPKLARREPDGTWATFPYHGFGEFYADFARYELTVTTPADFVVGATGEMTAEEREGDRVTRTFVADRVHDTAFCAWDRFEELVREADGVSVRLLYPPGYESAAEMHMDTTVEGLAHFGRLFGEYPYPTLTVIVPPRGADGAAGMEYPTLFLTAGAWYVLEGVHFVGENVTAHELAHMWFQGLVGTNEVKWPMLDEGITQWATGEYLRHRWGRRRSALGVGRVTADQYQLMRILSFLAGPRRITAPGNPAHAFSGSEYGRSVYARTSIVLETAARVWGRNRTYAALGEYAREHRYGHPEPHHLFEAFDRNLWTGFSRAVLEPALMDGEDAEVRIESLRRHEDDDEWVAEIDARRVGRVPIPVWVELVDSEGDRHRIRWPGRDARLRATHRGPHEIVSAEIDPERHNLLDPKLRDNERRLGLPETDGAWTRLLFAVQQILMAVGP